MPVRSKPIKRERKVSVNEYTWNADGSNVKQVRVGMVDAPKKRKPGPLSKIKRAIKKKMGKKRSIRKKKSSIHVVKGY